MAASASEKVTAGLAYRIHPVRAAVVVGQAAWAVPWAGLFQF